MSALNSDRNTPYREGDVLVLGVAAGAKIFAGSLVCANATGFAVPGSVSTTQTYLGRADVAVNNVDGVDGARGVKILRKKAFHWANHPADLVTQADLGKTCYVVDDQTVAKTNGANTRSAAGRVLEVTSSGVWVE